MENNRQNLIYAAAVLHSIITGLSYLFSKTGLNLSSPWDLLAFRFTVSFFAIMIPILFNWIKIDLTREKIKSIMPLALFYPLSFFTFQTFGLLYMTSSESGILLAVTPVFTLILAAYFLKEKTSIMQKLSIILSVSGVVYIALHKGADLEFNNIKGIALLLLSALSFSGYSVTCRRLSQNFSVTEMSTVMIIISFICFNAISISSHIINGTIDSFFEPLNNSRFIVSIVYLGVFSSLGTSMLTNYILSRIEASKMCVFTNLSTVISITAGVIFLNEKIYYYHIAGSICIVLGVIGTNCFGKKDDSITG
ncbi:MAG: DMT family transporter [Synergistaceae bacterium]|nr:DMT family transporter [Synergistaceae bacterium]